MECHVEEINQVPKSNGEANFRKTDGTSHSLGLQDLYKAAFSQESAGHFNEYEKDIAINPRLITETGNKFYDENEKSSPADGKNEIVYKNSSLEETYPLYDLKNLPFADQFRKSDVDKDDIQKQPNLTYAAESQEGEKSTFPENMALVSTPVILQNSFLHYGNEDANSVLDLDKGIQIQIVKVTDPPDNSSNSNFIFENREYSGDSQILQRYLCDSAMLKSDSNGLSNPSSSQDSLVFLNNQNNNNNNDTNSNNNNNNMIKTHYINKEVGINPEAFGVRYEDCDFNSSDSFASTESIIPKNIKCPKCPKKFMFKSDLMRHDKYKHSVKPKLSCKFCNKEFISQQNLIFHEKSHKKRTANKCEMCKKIFKKPTFLVKHMMKKHSKSASFNCNQCSKVFTSQLMLNNHFKKFHVPDAEKPYECEVCSKRFEKKKGLSCHAKAHLEEQPYVCQVCSKAFAKINYLKNHQKSHSNEEKDNFICDTCGKDFKTSNSLAEHMRKHTGEKPFTCNVCMKQFACKAYFNVHIRKHAEIKPFACNYCEKRFVTTTDLNKHERSHTKEKPYRCINCNADFSQQSNLITHWKKQRCSGSKTQEICTQTAEYEFAEANNAANMPLQNVNVIVDQSFTNQQQIVLTSIGNFINSNSVPVIITQTPNIPYSLPTLS